MIEQETIEGRKATVAYMKEGFEPASKDEATLIKVVFEDGEVIWLTPPRAQTGSCAGGRFGKKKYIDADPGRKLLLTCQAWLRPTMSRVLPPPSP